MIIAFSGWRGPRPPQRGGAVDPVAERIAHQTFANIREAAADVLRGLFERWPHAHYRVGDCRTGLDHSIALLFSTQKRHGGWLGGAFPGNRTLATFKADWRDGRRAGPDRNERMLVGDGTSHGVTGVVNLLVALPEPGDRQPVSGTWRCIEQAHKLHIPVSIVPILSNGRLAAPHLPHPRLPMLGLLPAGRP